MGCDGLMENGGREKMAANKRIELVAFTQDFTDAQVTRAAEPFLESLSDGKAVIEMDVRREDFPVVYVVKSSVDDTDFRDSDGQPIENTLSIHKTLAAFNA
jgi:hypothetical protein